MWLFHPFQLSRFLQQMTLASQETQKHLEVIARLEQKVAELSYMVQQNRSFSQTPPHMTPPPPQRIRENMHIPLPFPNLDGLN